MSDYEYDENLPYVLVAEGEEEGKVIARFAEKSDAEHSTLQSFLGRVIDTTPKPRVPNDARFITWAGWDFRHYAERLGGNNWVDAVGTAYALEDLPGTRPSTVFTVLDERKSDD